MQNNQLYNRVEKKTADDTPLLSQKSCHQRRRRFCALPSVKLALRKQYASALSSYIRWCQSAFSSCAPPALESASKWSACSRQRTRLGLPSIGANTRKASRRQAEYSHSFTHHFKIWKRKGRKADQQWEDMLENNWASRRNERKVRKSGQREGRQVSHCVLVVVEVIVRGEANKLTEFASESWITKRTLGS